jgi:hypothetical protein
MLDLRPLAVWLIQQRTLILSCPVVQEAEDGIVYEAV